MLMHPFRFISAVLILALPAWAQFPPTPKRGKTKLAQPAPAASTQPSAAAPKVSQPKPAEPDPVTVPPVEDTGMAAAEADPSMAETMTEPAEEGSEFGSPIAALDTKKSSAAGSQAADSTTNILSAEEKTAGWKLLFDGTKLTGLRGSKPGDPLKLGWTVEDGALKLPKSVSDTGRITGGALLTNDFFVDFDFRFEFKLSVSGASGIMYLFQEMAGNVRPPLGHEYQITDDVHNPVSLRGGPLRRTGALDGVIPAGPNAHLLSADPQNGVMEPPWNSGRILVKGSHVEHWLNDELVAEYELGSADLKQAIITNKAKVPLTFGNKMRSRIALVDEGLEVSFRNLKILPLAPVAAAPVKPAVGTATRPAVPTRP